MATLADIGVSALINIVGAFVFLLAFALLRIQPINDRVYFPKWYILKKRSGEPSQVPNLVGRFINLNLKTYLTFLNWMPQALSMSEPEIIAHAGLDSAVFLRIYTLGLKIFGPTAIVALLVLIPVNASGGSLFFLRKDLVVSEIDNLSISNISPKSLKFFVHLAMEYLFSFWTCYMLYKEYGRVASMRFKFLASRGRRVEQFTPRQSGHSISDSVEMYFKKTNPDHYLCHQVVYDADNFAKLVRRRNRLRNRLDYYLIKFERNPKSRPTMKIGFLGLFGQKVDSINYYSQKIGELDKRLTMKRDKMAQQLLYHSIQHGQQLTAGHILEEPFGLEKVAPFLRPLIEWKVIKSFLQGFLPGLALKVFLAVLPTLLMIMSKIEGHVALSLLERRTAAKYYYFMLVNVFLGSIVAGTAFQQLHAFLHQSATQIPRNIGVSIPMKATFFITYIMVDGWAGIASEILRLKPLVIFHLKNMFLVKTERDREKAMSPGSVSFHETLPTLQLYFLLGIVYAVITPILLPFILVFFALAHLVYRHQVINVYDQQYESAAAFWPHVHGRIIASLVISQLLLMGLLSTKKAAKSTPLLILLPILTLAFHKYCKNRFEPAFRQYPLEEAIEKDMEQRGSESDGHFKARLADAYLHPIFHSFGEVEIMAEEIYTKNQDHI
ncbi:unnamed protein product [Cuscuta campestris]|uniref:CSC1/OSCA1-like 7TM region domain-containing protein n=1 Tax=Cuscuta campestris TaxID=132261 RepID=A0A484L3H5_9ASTE|nr:unnamed protein product [Cuscuta campestris]